MNMKPIRYIKENFGKIPFCNEKPDTAPHLGKFCFPVCWRCFALITSILITYLVAHVWLNMIFPLWISFVMICPTVIDGIAQYIFGILSNNRRRCIIGIISGIGITMTILHIPQYF